MTRIAGIEAREKAATAGPWACRRQGYGDKERSKVQSACEDLAIIAVTLHEDQQRANGDFIAHAREDISYLLTELRDREGKLKAVEDATNDLDDLAQSAKDNGAVGVAQGIWAHVTRYNRILKGGE